MLRKVHSFRQRGAPVYVRQSGRTVSLVPEAEVTERGRGAAGQASWRSARPAALYVIDEAGVRSITFRRPLSVRLGLLLAMVTLPACYLYIRSRSGSDGR